MSEAKKSRGASASKRREKRVRMNYARLQTANHCNARGCDELESRLAGGRHRAPRVEQQQRRRSRSRLHRATRGRRTGQAPAERPAGATSFTTAAHVRAFSASTPGHFNHPAAIRYSAATSRAGNAAHAATIRSRYLPSSASLSVAAPERSTNGSASPADLGETREARGARAGSPTQGAAAQAHLDCRRESLCRGSHESGWHLADGPRQRTWYPPDEHLALACRSGDCRSASQGSEARVAA